MLPGHSPSPSLHEPQGPCAAGGGYAPALTLPAPSWSRPIQPKKPPAARLSTSISASAFAPSLAPLAPLAFGSIQDDRNLAVLAFARLGSFCINRVGPSARRRRRRHQVGHTPTTRGRVPVQKARSGGRALKQERRPQLRFGDVSLSPVSVARARGVSARNPEFRGSAGAR